MEKERTLLITQTDPAKDTVYTKWLENGYHAGIIFKNCILPLRIIRRFWIHHRLPCENFWYNNWKTELANYDTLIVHASYLTMSLPKYVHQNYPNMRIIFWYWNKITGYYDEPCMVKDKNVEFWSFNEIDCQKYSMRYNIQ